jgi:hypothetical protein
VEPLLTPLQLAEVGVAVALGIALDVLVPEKRQRDVLALPSAPVARRVERLESGFRELSATTGLPEQAGRMPRHISHLGLLVPPWST